MGVSVEMRYRNVDTIKLGKLPRKQNRSQKQWCHGDLGWE